MTWRVPLPDSPLARLQANQQLLIATAIMILSSLAIADRAVIQPLARRADALTNTLATTHHETELVQTLRATDEALAAARRRLRPSRAATPLLQELTALATAHQITVEAVSPQPAQAIGRYTRFPIRLEATGTFADMLRFLHAVHTAPIPWRVDQMELDSSAAALQIRLTISTLLRGADADG